LDGEKKPIDLAAFDRIKVADGTDARYLPGDIIVSTAGGISWAGFIEGYFEKTDGSCYDLNPESA
jgi:hypothetical protein